MKHRFFRINGLQQFCQKVQIPSRLLSSYRSPHLLNLFGLRSYLKSIVPKLFITIEIRGITGHS